MKLNLGTNADSLWITRHVIEYILEPAHHPNYRHKTGQWKTYRTTQLSPDHTAELQKVDLIESWSSHYILKWIFTQQMVTHTSGIQTWQRAFELKWLLVIRSLIQAFSRERGTCKKHIQKILLKTFLMKSDIKRLWWQKGNKCLVKNRVIFSCGTLNHVMMRVWWQNYQWTGRASEVEG